VKPSLLACAMLAFVAAACGGEAPGGPVELDDAPSSPEDLTLGADDAGNAVAAWPRGDGVAASRFVAATRGWSPAVPLDAGTGGADQLDLSVAPGGDATLVWRQASAGLASVWSSWVDGRTGSWQPPTLVERDDTGDAAEPCVATLPTGGGVAVWHQWDGLRESLWANTLGDAPLRWTGRALLETTDSADALEPDVAADPRGNAVAVWTQSDGASVTVWTARRRSGAATWDAPLMLGVSGVYVDGATPRPRVALDAAGDGLALWTMITGRSSGVWASRYDAAADAWSVPAPIEEASARGESRDAVLALDGHGGGFAAWCRLDGEGRTALWAATFTPARGWQDATRLDEDGCPPALAAAGEGQAVVVWQPAARASLRTSVFDGRAGAWGAPSSLDGNEGEARGARVAMDPLGNVLTIFTRARPDGPGSAVWAVRARP
jgi:hypothetical protein